MLVCCGDWAGAETELTGAISDLEAARPGMVGGGLVRLGELRARQGRPQDARELFERAGVSRQALLGLGGLALDEGDAEGAADAAERVLRRLPPDNIVGRIAGVELLARARAQLGELAAAAAACADLERAAAAIGTPYLDGRAELVKAEVLMARGGYQDARRACEDALD